MNIMNGRAVMTIREAVMVWRVTRRTIYNWMDTGKIEFIRTAGGSPRIFADSLPEQTHGRSNREYQSPV
jgi:excisionase family DNA binding protein